MREWDEEAERKSKRARHQAAIAAAEQLLHNLQRGFDAEELASRLTRLRRAHRAALDWRELGGAFRDARCGPWELIKSS